MRMKKESNNKTDNLSKLSLRDAYQCFGYAFNTLFLNPRFSEHLTAAGIEPKKAIAFAKGISDDLHQFAEEHATNMLRRKIFLPQQAGAAASKEVTRLNLNDALAKLDEGYEQ